jgi:hypothetical protein
MFENIIYMMGIKKDGRLMGLKVMEGKKSR